MQPEFIMLIGPPGVGKSTWLKNFFATSPETLYAVISTDALVEARMVEHNVDYTEAFSMVPKDESDQMVFNKLYGCLKQGYSIIIDQTNMDKITRAQKLAIVPDNYVKKAIAFETPEEVVRQRLLAPERVKSGKIIPEAVLNLMFSTYERPDTTEFDEITIIA